MLSGINIENVALISSAELTLQPGFTAMTGETGAGKSIFVDSLMLLAGAKAQKELIRTGTQACNVTGTFDFVPDSVYELLDAAGINSERDGQLIISRTVSSDGRSACRINGRPAPLSLLREAASLLIVIYGQNDSLYLCDDKKHIEYLDAYTARLEKDFDRLLEEYSRVFRELGECTRELTRLSAEQKSSADTAERLRLEISEISAAKLKPSEEEELFALRSRLMNAEKISAAVKLVTRAVSGLPSKRGASELLMLASAKLSELSDILPGSGVIAEKLMNLSYEASAASDELSSLCPDDYDDPAPLLDKTEARIDAIYKLKLRYGKDIPEVLSRLEESKKRLASVKNTSALITEAEGKRSALITEALRLSSLLHEARLHSAASLETEISESLSYLDMPGVGFSVCPELRSGTEISVFDRHGADNVIFKIRTNTGEPFLPLSSVASGGELSRIMLSLQTVLTTSSDAGTMIFDEIDTGVSGKTARKLGLMLRRLGAGRQVFCVTHSAQVAGAADCHVLAEKAEAGARTETSFFVLDRDRRIAELARILGGITVTENTRRSAEELLLS